MRRLRERLRGGADYQRVDVAAAELSGGESEVEEAAGASHDRRASHERRPPSSGGARDASSYLGGANATSKPLDGTGHVVEFAATGVGRAGVVLMLANSTSADLIAHVRVRAHQIQK